MARKLKEGMTVVIFTDPLTRRFREGKAELISRLDTNPGIFDKRELQTWEVDFHDTDEGLTVERQILQ